MLMTFTRERNTTNAYNIATISPMIHHYRSRIRSRCISCLPKALPSWKTLKKQYNTITNASKLTAIVSKMTIWDQSQLIFNLLNSIQKQWNFTIRPSTDCFLNTKRVNTAQKGWDLFVKLCTRSTTSTKNTNMHIR